MPYKTLPANADLAHLKHQAKDLIRGHQAHDSGANQRIREFHPRFLTSTDADISAAPFTLSDAQYAVAREHGFASWAKLKAGVQAPVQSDLPYQDRIEDPVFRRAVDLLDAGEAAGLATHLKAHPGVVRQRVFFSISAYFGSPTRVVFVAENPVRRGSSPAVIGEVVGAVLEAGAKADHAAMDRTLGLVSSGRVVRECGVQIPLIDLLCDYGAEPDAAMAAALGHGEFTAVEALLRRGAHLDLPAAAAIGRDKEARELLPSASDEDRHRALAYATQFGRIEVVRLLLDAGVDPNRFNPIGCHSHSTPLHQAAFAGHLNVVKLLVERGADVTVKDVMWGATPLGWAEHAGQSEVVGYLKSLA